MQADRMKNTPQGPTAGRSLPVAARAAFVALVALALAFAGASAPAYAAPPKVEVTLSVSSTELAKGEMVWMRGKVTNATTGEPVAGAKVRIERRTKNGWKRLKTRTTKSNGKFGYELRASKGKYRARVVATSKARKATSAKERVEFSVKDRKLAERSRELGKRTGKVRDRGETVRLAGGTRAKWRNYSKLMLVEVTKNDKRRTWLVPGDIRDAYRKAGGPEGRLGAPLSDPRCGLRADGCVQRFQGGSIYDTRNTSRATVVYGKGRRTEVLAAALSQDGYQEPVYRASKFNKWINSVGRPWCSAFVSWAAAAVDSKAIPKHARLFQLYADLRANAPERFRSKPKQGALAMYDYNNDGITKPTHIGLVLEVRKNTIVTVEGNTANPRRPRVGGGVHKKVRPQSEVLFYWYPRY